MLVHVSSLANDVEKLGYQQLLLAYLQHLEDFIFDKQALLLVALQVFLHRSILNIIDVNIIFHHILQIKFLLQKALVLVMVDLDELDEEEQVALLQNPI